MPADTTAAVQRENQAGLLVPWKLADDPESADPDGVASATIDQGTRTRLDALAALLADPATGGNQATIITALAAILAELGQKLEAGQTVAVTGTQTDALTDTELRAAAVTVTDDYLDELLTADQAGADDVLTFTLGAAAGLVAVDVDPVDPEDTAAYVCRAVTDGVNNTPTATLGHRCRSGQTTYLPYPTAGTVKVWAPAGVTVSVQGGQRA